MQNGKKALIAMSGGVDSSVAACLMKQQGYTCIGVTMKLYDNEEIGVSSEKTCCTLKDVEDARFVAQALDMPYYVLNFKDKFEEEVIQRFVDTYIEGGTPNPCIDCNHRIKFRALMRRMEELDYDYVVTGHYARISYDENSGKYILKKALDSSKDQSYVLYNLTQEQLAHTLFPLGEYEKTEARKIAEANGLLNAQKHDSQDICFVPDGDYGKFIEEYCERTGKEEDGAKFSPFEAGDFITEDGRILGHHKGIIHYTIGQRKGLGLSLPQPLYVCRKDLEKNQVVLAPNERLFRDTLEAGELNFISGEYPRGSFRCCAKIRYKQKEAPATVTPIDENRVKVVFDEPQRGITPGQAVVFYDGDQVLDGGRILRSKEE